MVNYASPTAVEEHEEAMDLSFEGPLTDLDSEGTTEPPQKRKQRKRAKAAEPVVYDIPPVKTKASTFKGESEDPNPPTVPSLEVFGAQVVWDTYVPRLTSLAFQLTAAPGLPKHCPPYCETGPHILQQVSWVLFYCLPRLPHTAPRRTCRIVSIEKNGLDFVKDLGLQNVRDLCKIIQVRSITVSPRYCITVPILFIKWNEDNKYGLICDDHSSPDHMHHVYRIRFMRLSSEIFPFASHGKYGYSLDYAAAELKASVLSSVDHHILTSPSRRQETSQTGMVTG